MINFRRYLKWKNNEQMPIILLIVSVITIIHLCNKHDEMTANQYVYKDPYPENPQTCPLYPSSLQGKHDIID